jgi:hypothetical protein
MVTNTPPKDRSESNAAEHAVSSVFHRRKINMSTLIHSDAERAAMGVM